MDTHTCASCATSDATYLERVNYFPGQLMTAADMAAEQNYQRTKAKRHNRLLHGWGVVCGLWVKPKLVEGKPNGEVTVGQGSALGPYGDEIIVDSDVTVNVLTEDLEGNAVPCGGEVDPWCASVQVDRPTNQPYYLAIRYAECKTRPVLSGVGGCGCGCGDKDCEYSRIRDSFVVKVLDKLPSSYPDPFPPGSDFNDVIFCGGAVRDEDPRPCPPCPAEPWLILATFRVDSKGVVGNSIDNLKYRRFVAAWGTFYYTCGSTGGGDKLADERLRHVSAVREKADSESSEEIASDVPDEADKAEGTSTRPTAAEKRAAGKRSTAKRPATKRPSRKKG